MEISVRIAVVVQLERLQAAGHTARREWRAGRGALRNAPVGRGDARAEGDAHGEHDHATRCN